MSPCSIVLQSNLAAILNSLRFFDADNFLHNRSCSYLIITFFVIFPFAYPLCFACVFVQVFMIVSELEDVLLTMAMHKRERQL